MFRRALVLCVGTTKDPLIKAVDEFVCEHGLVVLIYGRGFPGQEPHPFDVAAEVREYCKSRGLSVELYEVSDPEDLDEVISCCGRVFRDLVERFNVREVVVNYTGGTKPMATGLVYSALTCPYNISVILEYVGGGVRDKFGRVVREAMKISRSVKTQYSVLRDRILEYARRYAYSQALAISEFLPESGVPGFLRKSIKALYYWDNFNYDYARRLLDDLGGIADVLREYSEYSGIADTVSRLKSIAPRVAYLNSELKKLNSNPRDERCLRRVTRDPDGLILLSLDVFENAYRRFVEGRYVDSVLRVYRCIESLSQSLLMLKLGIVPWKANWEVLGSDIERVKSVLCVHELPENIGCYGGLKVLELYLGSIKTWDKILTIMQLRNYSHLEHGYIEVDREKAENSLNIAREVIKELTEKIGIDKQRLIELWEKLKHKL